MCCLPSHAPGQTAVLLGDVPQLHHGVVGGGEQPARPAPAPVPAPAFAFQEANRGHPALVRLEVHERALVSFFLLVAGAAFAAALVSVCRTKRKKQSWVAQEERRCTDETRLADRAEGNRDAGGWTGSFTGRWPGVLLSLVVFCQDVKESFRSPLCTRQFCSYSSGHNI